MLLVLLGTFALPTQGMLALLWACGAGVPTVVAARTLQSAALVGRLVGSATEAGAAAADGASLVILADVRPPPEGEGGRRGCGAQQERRLPRGLRRPVHERQAQPASRMRAARPGTGCSGCTADAVLRSQRARCENRAHSCKSPSMAAGREATQG